MAGACTAPARARYSGRRFDSTSVSRHPSSLATRAQHLERLIGHGAPLGTGEAHALSFVVERPVMWWRGEDVARRNPESLDVERKGRDHIVLAGERVEHAPLVLSPLVAEHQLALRDVGGEEFATHALSIPVVVGGELEHHRRVTVLAPQQAGGHMHAERRGVVIGVPTFAGMRQHDSGDRAR